MEQTHVLLLRQHTDRYHQGKRWMDISLSLTLLLLLWPLFLITGMLILLDSPGASPIFVQVRVGLEGKPFRMYKFRTMVPQAERLLPELLLRNEMDGPVFKLRQDPRITRLGKILRSSGLDELPQLWNVLRGDMSLVGPRPALPREVARYGPRERLRLTAKPGITCLWQIQPDRNSLSFARWMELDLEYLQTRSLGLDLQILLATVRTVLRRDGQ